MSSEQPLFAETDKVVLNKRGISPINILKLKAEGYWEAEGIVESISEVPQYKTPAGYRVRKVSRFEYLIFFEGLGHKVIHESYLSRKKDGKKQKQQK